MSDRFTHYAQQIQKNSRALAATLMSKVAYHNIL
jgi:glycine/serine hydroxymethyltransferase